jgi:hypothetical protein
LTPSSSFRFKGIRATQAAGQEVFSFAAAPQDILQFADIDRVGRNEDGTLRGFQRHLVSAHIHENRDYLANAEAILPNAVIVAFMGGVTITDCGNGIMPRKSMRLRGIVIKSALTLALQGNLAD